MADNRDGSFNNKLKSIPDINSLVEFQIRRNITSLFKQFLLILEDLQDLDANISDKVFQDYRKRVLDQGNDTLRELLDLLAGLDVNFKK